MQFKNIALATCMALSASVAASGVSENATDIAPSVQKRLVQLDLGYKKTGLYLNALVDDAGNLTSSAVVQSYLSIVSDESDDVTNKTQPAAGTIPDTTQLILCQSYHSMALSGIELNAGFVNHANYFNKTERAQVRRGLMAVNDETNKFFSDVGKKSLTYCEDALSLDNQAIHTSIRDAARALDPSKAAF
ncbi:hypothetical protein PENANT_c004G03252 [Penicillium antarcticum]|uniref:Pectinesterase inhibitor domain-containing protein n=1 Tax=Penicillium antarcticum TaxID=416450 RepID=A0A1V6QFX7_9EURO|nr:uncharacterized protein N7508_002442 [Penicillium antarcticum]KAJ5317934.1 hypothetical protein N7508_002442 [Penicillium antarcticum]OQD88109.1 hypothetical protein PENANT_c004G03252 [Penicillium antarcticum]